MNVKDISGEVYASQTVVPDGCIDLETERTKLFDNFRKLQLAKQYSFKPTGGTNVFKEDNMNERMTRKELTEKVKELEWADYNSRVNAREANKAISMLGKVVALLEGHLGVIATETEAVPSKLVLKKVRKPYTRKK